MSTPNPATTDWVPLGSLGVPPNQVCGCRVYHNANQAITVNTVTPITFNSERWDTDNIHDPTVNPTRLTCQTAGKYHIFGHFHWSGDPGGNNQVHFRLNGSAQIHSEIFFPVNQFSRAISTVYDLAVGDYVEFTCYTSASSMNINSAAQFSPEFGMILQGGPAGTPGSPGPTGAAGDGSGAAFGSLVSRPAASANTGKFYYATDQDVMYISNGTTWLRIGNPAGATTQVYSNTVPTGWWAYDGTALPSSTGIYADLATHLGGTACPDTRGRVVIPKGTHADVDVLGDNDGVALANRTPKHNSTITGAPSYTQGTLPNHYHSHSLTLPGHHHPIHKSGAQAVGSGGGLTDVWGIQYASGTFYDWTNNSNEWGTPAISGGVNDVGTGAGSGVGGSVGVGTLGSGPGGTRPADMPSYITFSVVMAKL